MLVRKGLIGSFSIALLAGLFIIALVPKANASEWNERTIVKFAAPVEVPGRVLLPGTYTFQLMNSSSNRNIVEIVDKDRTKLYAIVETTAAYRLNPTSKTVFTLAERPNGAPMAIRKWFYPGNSFGQEFLYGRHAVTVDMAIDHSRRRWGKPGARVNS